MHSTTTSGFAALIAFFASPDTLTRSARPSAGDLAEVAARLRRIDVHGADDPEPLALGHLPDDAGADRSEPDVHDPDRAGLSMPFASLLSMIQMNATMDYTCRTWLARAGAGVLV